MSNSTETTTKRVRARRQDRRDAEAPRLQYEALVEVGADAGGFEAESLDVSLDGMRMRTAYLPEIGQTLTCRFDGFGGEITVEAEVVWSQAEARGGEFGIRFVGLDAHALTLLNDLCSPENLEDEDDEPSQTSSAAVGTRVRLHIEGLGSPMRARVRDAAHGEVLIGSNLEFLKVGRGVELENVDHGKKRVAHIEHVGVEIDPESNVPQLVVALSYESSGGLEDDYSDEVHGELTTAPYRTKVAVAEAVRGDAESTPEPTVIDQSERPSDIELNEAAAARVAQVPPPSVDPSAPVEAEEPIEDAVDDEDEEFEAEEDEVVVGSRVAARRATEKVGAIARKLGPKLVSAGHSAKGAFGSLMSSVSSAHKRHAERRQAKAKSKAPKRVTAPPPSSATRPAKSRRLRGLRSQRPATRTSDQPVSTDVETPEVEVTETSGRKRTVVTALMAAAAVVAIYFVSTHVRGMVDASPDEAVAAATGEATATAATPQLPAMPGAAQGDATANVPLFGATPLSTTEAVPAPPAPGEAAEPGAASDDAAPKKEAAVGNLATEWGVGEVNEPTVLRLKMDGKIAGISGTETASGFTIMVPNRKSVSSAAGLARKDKRIDSVNVVNYPDRAEVTIHFKKEVPAFNVQAKGKRLIIEIATKKKSKKKKKKKRR